ncbi:hypothetical protein Agub_g6863, partial [Astrephomene gubernaculifera]
FVGLTRLHLSGVQLDSLGLLSRLRGLTDLSLHLPPEGCDAARRHNVTQLAPLCALSSLELSSGAGGGGAAGGAAGGGGAAAEQLFLNDARLQALARGCRRLVSFSFRGTLQLSSSSSSSSCAALSSLLPRLTRLHLHNDSDAAAATLALHSLPPG